MYFYIYILTILFNVYLNNGENFTKTELVTISDIAEEFINIFNNGANNKSKRINDLKEKLSKINTYIKDSDKYEKLIMNTIKQNKFKNTNFYNALTEKDHYRFLNNTKNLYLALKEKMNRDDLLRILLKRGESKVQISAKRMLSGSSMLKRQRDKALSETVEKFLMGTIDNHSFEEKLKHSDFWDPRIELEERRNFHHPSRRLYKGERTTVRYYPFVVSIHVMGRFWCGGALYWKDLVITSAACLQLMHNNRYYRENPRAVAVRVGSNHSRVGGDMIDALEVFFHPTYNPKTLEHNIALIRLRRQVYLDYHRVPKLIQISQSDQGIPFTAEVLLLGWGVSTAAGTMPFEPLFLQRKFLPVYPSKNCEEVYGDNFNIHHMFCAGTVTTGEGACSHDAGGPAVLNGKLVGIISYGPTICGFPDAPTVLTTVGFYADWIETINETMPGYYRGLRKTTTTTESNIDYLFERWRSTSKVYAFRARDPLTALDSLDIENENMEKTEENSKQFYVLPVQEKKLNFDFEKYAEKDNFNARARKDFKETTQNSNADTNLKSEEEILKSSFLKNSLEKENLPKSYQKPQKHEQQYGMKEYALQAGNVQPMQGDNSFEGSENIPMKKLTQTQEKVKTTIIDDYATSEDDEEETVRISQLTKSMSQTTKFATNDDDEIEPNNDPFLLDTKKERYRKETQRNLRLTTTATTNRESDSKFLDRLDSRYRNDLQEKILNQVNSNEMLTYNRLKYENSTTEQLFDPPMFIQRNRGENFSPSQLRDKSIRVF